MELLSYKSTYRNVVKALIKSEKNYDSAMHKAVGGNFEEKGAIETELLLAHGLKPNDYVVDVGCGSGRLAIPLSEVLPQGKFLGIDVVPELLDYAKKKIARKDWHFEVAKGLSIPEKDGVADYVCFFSVFTHLLHEQSYVYLKDALRVLKPEGKVVFSFLDFTVDNHWRYFEHDVEHADQTKDRILNMFMGADLIRKWAQRLNLKVVGIYPGDKPQVDLKKAAKRDDGKITQGPASLGQSVCVLEKA